MNCSNRNRDVSEKLWRKNEGGMWWWIKSKKCPLVPPQVNYWHPLLHAAACLLGAPVDSAWGLRPGWGTMRGHARCAREIIPLDSVWTNKNRNLEDKSCLFLTLPLEQLVDLYSPSDYPNGMKLQYPNYHLLNSTPLLFFLLLCISFSHSLISIPSELGHGDPCLGTCS